MHQEPTLEQRVALLEAEVAELRQQLAATRQSRSWLDLMSGSMKDEPEFGEVIRLGREFRESQKDPEEKD